MGIPFVHRFCLCLVFILLANIPSVAQLTLAISSTGSWATTVPATDVTEAGNDFTGTYTSAANQKTLSVTNGGSNSTAEKNGYSWTISVRKVDTAWDNTAKIYVQRTGSGIPRKSSRPTTVTGGTTYQQITDTNQSFFSGYRGSTAIPIQYQLQGVSVVMAVKTYSTTIYYTVSSP